MEYWAGEIRPTPQYYPEHHGNLIRTQSIYEGYPLRVATFMKVFNNRLRVHTPSGQFFPSPPSRRKGGNISNIKAVIWIPLILGLATLLSLGLYLNPAAAQQSNTVTPSAMVGTPSSAFITVTYIEPINVRSGPSSFDYPVVGSIPVGGTAAAIGRSPAGEWIEIVFPDAPRGSGWIYAANVSLSAGALLPIVEPPPTPSPLMTPTLNPTFVAAFQILPTSTRLPTFTAPPSLVVPTYTNPANTASGHVLTAWVVVGLGLLGIVGMVLASFRRR